MKATELIAKLQAAVDVHGPDLEALAWSNDGYDTPVQALENTFAKPPGWSGLWGRCSSNTSGAVPVVVVI